MPAIDVDAFTFGYVTALSNATGKDHGTVVREAVVGWHADQPKSAPPATKREGPHSAAVQKLFDLIESNRVSLHSDVADRYLGVLSCLHRLHGRRFEEMLTVRGTRRIYFGRSSAEIAAANRSANPKRIPATEWWAEVRNPTDRKCKLLEEIMRRLEYPPGAAEVACRVLQGGRS